MEKMSHDSFDVGGLAAPRVSSSRFRPSLIWLVPAVAVLIGLSLMVQAWLAAGPQITISFQSATGLEAGLRATVDYYRAHKAHYWT